MTNHEETEFAGMTFEEAFERLEESVKALENGDLALDDALAQFEEGTRLARYCERLLNTAELRVQQLLTDGLGQMTLAPIYS